MEEEPIANLLIENALEYYENALEAEKKKQFNSAVTLFFKAISALCDCYILNMEGKSVSSHSERFKILRSKYLELYNIIDKDFPFYQDSYKIKLNQEVSTILKDDVKFLFKKLKVGI